MEIIIEIRFNFMLKRCLRKQNPRSHTYLYIYLHFSFSCFHPNEYLKAFWRIPQFNKGFELCSPARNLLINTYIYYSNNAV